MSFRLMAPRNLRLASLAGLAIATAACKREQPAPEPAASEAPLSPATAEPLPPPESSATPSASDATPALDAAALTDRGDPDRLLRYYAAALAARDWAAAAKAWGKGSGVTARTLKDSYDRADAPRLEVGKGEQEGAAGSIFYEAPVSLRFGSAPPERGSLVLRRVNDVDGATAEQGRWHIERSTIGAGQ